MNNAPMSCQGGTDDRFLSPVIPPAKSWGRRFRLPKFSWLSLCGVDTQVAAWRSSSSVIRPVIQSGTDHKKRWSVLLGLMLLAADLLGQTPPTAPPRSEAKPAARPPAAARPSAPSYRDLKYPPLRPIQIPTVETYPLPNGMKLDLLEDHELPVVNGTALVRTGNLFDPRDKIGLATLTGIVMRTGGTKTRTG